jgi:hypothetical protein
MPEGKQQSQTVAAAHNNNTYRDRLYLTNTATKAKEFQLSTAGLLFQRFINSLFLERDCCLSNVLEYATNQKEPSQIPILYNNTRGFTTDRAAIAQAVAASSFFIRFHKATSFKPPEN